MGAAAQIRGEILALRDQGCAVLVLSEELEELFEICDRLHVVAKGRLSPSLDRQDATVEKVGAWMSGLWDEGAALTPALSREREREESGPLCGHSMALTPALSSERVRELGHPDQVVGRPENSLSPRGEGGGEGARASESGAGRA